MKTLRKGDAHADVCVLQRALHLTADGRFGPVTEEAVKEFQKEMKAQGRYSGAIDGIVGPKTWALLDITPYPTGDVLKDMKKSKRRIDKIIVHCTSTPEGRPHTVADITKWHKEKGWATIGYHYVVYLDGSIHTGRDVDLVGAHCTGQNTYSIGVVYVGGTEKYDVKVGKDTRTSAQKKALLALMKKLKTLYPKATIHGHDEFANKACPCFKAKEEYKTI